MPERTIDGAPSARFVRDGMGDGAVELRGWLRSVRRRWQWSAIWRVLARTALSLALLLWSAWVIVRLVPLGRVSLVLLATVCVVAGAALIWIQVRSLRKRPSNHQIARFVEEQCPELSDLIVTASQRLDAATPAPFDGLMFQSALTQATALDPDRIVSRSALRKSAVAALALTAVLLAAVVMLRQPAWRAFQTARMIIAPPSLTWLVTPGDARVRVGTPLKIVARLDGLLDGVMPEPAALQLKIGNRQRTLAMTQSGSEYRAELPVDADFHYRIVAGRNASRDYKVDALHPAHVERIDLEYQYPEFTGLKPRHDADSGDIYGPPGTKVTLRIKTDKPVMSGALAMRGGAPVPLTTKTPTETEASLTLDKDGAYRVTLNDIDGLSNVDDTEYFIRLMNDRPADVRIMRPSGDRQVTRLEEIAIEARADDDFGVQQLDLVYSVRGGPEHVVPLHKASPDHDETNVDVTHTLYIEDLDVQPGDFITYYARARDIPRGKRSTESRSDIFFLEVRPYGEQFVAAESSAAFMGGNADTRDLLQAQKEIIVASWKVERRSQAGQSEQDIRAIARAQGELRQRAEQIAANGGIIVNQGQRMHGQGPNPQAADANEPIVIAAKEMAKAQDSLEALKTGDAIPHEMTAYNELLKTQADSKQTTVARARAGGNGQQTGTQDLSALFDKELLRQSENAYETRTSVEQRQDQKQDSALDKLRDLARRQDDLARQQQELARQRANLQPEEMKRQLERLTKEQDDLRRQAESLAQQLAQQQKGQSEGPQSQPNQQGQQQGQQAQSSQSGAEGQQSAQGRPQNQAGLQNQASPQNQTSQSAQGQNSQSQSASNGQNANAQGQASSDAMRDAANEMADAAKQLARGDLTNAADRAQRTLSHLRDLERMLRGSQPDERKRAMGELQLEAEQMSEGQHRLSADARRLQQQGRSGSGGSGDTLRRMAGEQERLAERANALRRGLADLSATATGGSRPDQARAADQDRAALSEAQGELSRQKLEQRMREAASALRSASGQGLPGEARQGQGQKQGQSQRQSQGEGPDSRELASLANQQDELARAIDSVAQRMGASVSNNADARKLSDQLAQVRAHRNRLNELGQRIDELTRQNDGKPGAAGKGTNSAKNGTNQSQQAQNGKPGVEAGQKGPQNSQKGQNAQNGAAAGPTAGNAESGPGGADRAAEIARLQAEVQQTLRETQDLLNGLQRDQQGTGGGPGGGYGSFGGSTPTAPDAPAARNAGGTEAFKQDYSKWDLLRRDVTFALEQAETSLAQRLSAHEGRDRLNAGGDDRAPDEYADSVSRYYRSLAKRTPKS